MEKKDIEKEYSNGEVTVVWRPSKCIHSAKCWKGEDGLLSVFDPTKRPWVNPEGAASERIVEQIKKCPSGALDYYYNDKAEAKETASTEIDGTAVQVMENGPLIIKGDVMITLPDGSTETREKMCALCRCGASANKPYCDGSHKGMTL